MRKAPDYGTVTGILEDIAPPVDDRTELDHVKSMVMDLELQYFDSGRDPRERIPFAKQLVAENRLSTGHVPVSYGPKGRPVRDSVRVSRVGNSIQVDGDSHAIQAMIRSRNPTLPFTVTAEVPDTRTMTYVEPGHPGRQGKPAQSIWDKG